MLPIISDTAMNALSEAAGQIQAELASCGDGQAIEDINGALSCWLELCIESLAEEALYHCVTGDLSNTLNRQGFERYINRVKREPVSSLR